MDELHSNSFQTEFLEKNIYEKRLTQFLAKDEQLCLPNVHVLRLRQIILTHFSYMTSYMSDLFYFSI